ncbi:MAG TPA: glycosyltransferase [Acidimicrobiales bacterium]|nr:glycosyltransferase [Acidimicrobiales bacterium]
MPSNRESSWLVATSCDDRYLWPWACSLHSAVLNANAPIRFLIANVNGLLSPLGQQMAKDFLELLQVDGEIVDVSLDVGEVHKYDWNATVYARLGLMDLMEERFMWLDSDTILCTDWTKVFAEVEILMEDSNVVACGVLDRPSTLEQLRMSDTNTAYEAAQGVYFNAGVLFVDPHRWRRGGMDRLWGELVATQSERGFIYQDQDVLNFLLAGKVRLLPKGFNHIVSEATNGTESILHFAGFPKPWRLTERGRAFFMATEAVNFDRPNDQISGGGHGWELFPRYWEVERALVHFLQKSGDRRLASAFLGLREAQLMSPSVQEQIKFWGLRLVSKRILPH